jgi:hypothetical protein
MLISAFTFARNADKFYYPVKASICSVLPIADEIIIALADGDLDDKTQVNIQSIQNPKIKIFKRQWDPGLYAGSKVFAHETDFALSKCQGIWCLYLQADEVLHEEDLLVIQEACKRYESDLKVDGFLFNYVHFWGDYQHRLATHGLIPKEIRVIRNGIGCYSYKDAVSFRKGNNEKLNVVNISARIFHYGYLRPPGIMGRKTKVQHAIHRGDKEAFEKQTAPTYDWGPLGGLQKFEGTHPAVMREWMAQFNWQSSLNYRKPALFEKSPHKHLRTKYRLLTWIEKNLNGGEQIFGFKNYKLVKR